ncbi:MAG: methylenetetrahydrofolate reductase C-terminal domain-containing protein [Promethearchaeota archaeon]|jgi:ferredoxin
MTIITTKKPFEEVLGALKNVQKIGLVSCGSCAAMCQTGGTEGAKEMAEKLEEEGFEVVTTMVPEEVCDNRVMMKDLRKIDAELGEIDAILTLSCGLGVASITQVLQRKHPNIPVLIATNTEFMGMTERIGRFYQRCRGCGACLLNETGGICPITTCAKSLMNGPCGGMVKGRCEVGNYEKDCGWVLIYERLKELGQLDLFTKLRDPVNWSESGHQREIVWR